MDTKTQCSGIRASLYWELNILEIDAHNAEKPSKKEWLRRRVKRMRQTITEFEELMVTINA